MSENKRYRWHAIYDRIDEDIEVIGNIHENPELFGA